MDEPFIITVPYKGEEINLEAQLQLTGYTHRFRVVIDEVDIFFEPDEERQYRAIIPPEQAEAARRIDHALLQAVAATLHEVLS
jgi:DNA polymerase/3'-5' exonuclease PolX